MLKVGNTLQKLIVTIPADPAQLSKRVPGRHADQSGGRKVEAGQEHCHPRLHQWQAQADAPTD